jgi:hypothetical protein
LRQGVTSSAQAHADRCGIRTQDLRNLAVCQAFKTEYDRLPKSGGEFLDRLEELFVQSCAEDLLLRPGVRVSGICGGLV